ncbi:hypothetical protein B0T25DRAFT_53504 [Lasiosphaeria hispida]|uniref:Uncharacterized protein n=1 Tax=Lasiosphaeria hispida TaxID=260671 RepID=A0AAJ0MKF4_9PEZI|nr:hypothetical protein B0T25DRAFT_53504 [Lasiosphaeria hispida]
MGIVLSRKECRCGPFVNLAKLNTLSHAALGAECLQHSRHQMLGRHREEHGLEYAVEWDPNYAGPGKRLRILDFPLVHGDVVINNQYSQNIYPGHLLSSPARGPIERIHGTMARRAKAIATALTKLNPPCVRSKSSRRGLLFVIESVDLLTRSTSILTKRLKLRSKLTSKIVLSANLRQSRRDSAEAEDEDMYRPPEGSKQGQDEKDDGDLGPPARRHRKLSSPRSTLLGWPQIRSDGSVSRP